VLVGGQCQNRDDQQHGDQHDAAPVGEEAAKRLLVGLGGSHGGHGFGVLPVAAGGGRTAVGICTTCSKVWMLGSSIPVTGWPSVRPIFMVMRMAMGGPTLVTPSGPSAVPSHSDCQAEPSKYSNCSQIN